jgi:hypothetical protein
MITKPLKLFIGKDVARDADILGGVTLAAMINTAGTTPLQDGDLVVLDKNMKVLAPGATIADSDTIYIAMGHSVTFTVVNEAGTSIAARKIKLSDPIKAGHVKVYSGKATAAKAEQVWSTDLTGVTPTLAREYVLHIVYKDLYEHPGLFRQTFRHTAVAADVVVDCHVFGAAFAALVNADPNSRVTATWTDATDILALTGKPIVGCTTGLNDIDEFDMVRFECFFNYIDANGREQEFNDFTLTTNCSFGTGTWELMRDLEKEAWGNDGVSNRIQFPIILPEFRTVKSAGYNIVTIEHDVPYKTPNNLYSETTQVKTIIAFHNGANGDAQQAFVLSQLNPWMASDAMAFPNIAAL